MVLQTVPSALVYMGPGTARDGPRWLFPRSAVAALFDAASYVNTLMRTVLR